MVLLTLPALSPVTTCPVAYWTAAPLAPQLFLAHACRPLHLMFPMFWMSKPRLPGIFFISFTALLGSCFLRKVSSWKQTFSCLHLPSCILHHSAVKVFPMCISLWNHLTDILLHDSESINAWEHGLCFIEALPLSPRSQAWPGEGI